MYKEKESLNIGVIQKTVAEFFTGNFRKTMHLLE